MKKIAVFVILVLVLMGCGRKRLELATVHTPKLNKITTIEIGENLFNTTHAYFRDKSRAKISDSTVIEKYSLYSDTTDHRFTALDDAQCALHNREQSLMDYDCSGQFTHLRDGTKLETPIGYTIAPAPPFKLAKNSFKRVALYQGKVGNKISIAFQEFVRSNSGAFIIRDAFTQKIQYELDGRGEAIVGFKGLRIKVLSATNSNITYQVLSGYK